MSTLQTSNQFPEKKDISGLYAKVYADICFLLSADINKDRAILMGNFLNKHYLKVITPKDLMQAFEMYITDKLDDFLPADNKGVIDKTNYNKIDPALIQKVIKAFRLYRQKNKPKPELKTLPESREKKIEAENDVIKSIVNCYNKWIDTGYIGGVIPTVLVNRLKDANLYEEIEIDSKMLEKTFNKLKYKGNSTDLRSVLRKGVCFDNLGLVSEAAQTQMIESINVSFKIIKERESSLEIDFQDEIEKTRRYKL